MQKVVFFLNIQENRLVKFLSQILGTFSKFLDCVSETSGVSGAHIPSSSLSSGLVVYHCNLSDHLWGTLEINICHVEGSASVFHVSCREATCIRVIHLSPLCGLISVSTFSLCPGKRHAGTFRLVVRIIKITESCYYGEVPKPSGVANNCSNYRRSL